MNFRLTLQQNCFNNIKNYTTGKVVNEVKYIGEVCSSINTYALPSTMARPFGCFADYYCSGYAIHDYWCDTLSTWDVEDRGSYFSKELYTFDFKIRTLATAYQHKFNNLFLYRPNSDIRDLVNNIDMNQVKITARHEFPSMVVNDLKKDDKPRLRIHGTEGFREEKLE